MAESREIIEALNRSIEMEEEGRRFYIDASKKTKNEIGKRVFEALADDETRHIAAIRLYCDTIAKKDKSPQLCAAMPRHKDIKERLLFGRKEEELLKSVPEGSDALKAYEVAMQMENEGYAFYKKMFEGSQDRDLKDLYKFLLDEEETHYELIESTYKYMKDPEAWFAEQEKPIVEG
jgi:rubrerythrin